jgi:hypothetical protein
MDDWMKWWDEKGRHELADLLLREWDVLGVEVFEEQAEGEYGYEAEQLGPLLRDGVDRDVVAGTLTHLAEELQEGADAARDKRVAESALECYAHTEHPPAPR